MVRFGVDLDELEQITLSDAGTVVAAGRDISRDWGTLVDAVIGTGWDVRLVTRPSQAHGLHLSSRR